MSVGDSGCQSGRAKANKKVNRIMWSLEASYIGRPGPEGIFARGKEKPVSTNETQPQHRSTNSIPPSPARPTRPPSSPLTRTFKHPDNYRCTFSNNRSHTCPPPCPPDSITSLPTPLPLPSSTPPPWIINSNRQTYNKQEGSVSIMWSVNNT